MAYRLPSPRRLSAALALLALAPVAFAQWSKDPALNIQLSDGAGEEVQPKLAPAPDGFTYLSFYGSPARLVEAPGC
jgi:hypothetical protein